MLLQEEPIEIEKKEENPDVTEKKKLNAKYSQKSCD
jgi:hypothetical protein